jgi:hypothetical protein
MRDLPGLDKFSKVLFSVEMCIKISFKRRGEYILPEPEECEEDLLWLIDSK